MVFLTCYSSGYAEQLRLDSYLFFILLFVFICFVRLTFLELNGLIFSLRRFIVFHCLVLFAIVNLIAMVFKYYDLFEFLRFLFG